MRNIGRLWMPRGNADDSNVDGTVLYKFPDHVRVFLPSDKFAERLQPFSVQMIGFKFNLAPSTTTPDPVDTPWPFAAGVTDWQTGTHETPFALWWTALVGSVVAHPSGIVLAVHWWPTHDRVMNLSGPLPAGRAANDSIELAQTIFEVFREETRGAPRINRGRLMWALRTQGPRATQRGVATVLGIGESTIRDFLRRENLKWPKLKQQVYGVPGKHGKENPPRNP
jgi:hypothetical protein